MTQAPHNVLVADDEFASLEVLALLLEGEGFRVLTAADGEEAWQRLHEAEIALVITDYKMPKLDGGELCQKMLAEPRFSHIPVIFSSATYRQDVPRSKNVIAYFDKPLLFGPLLRTIRNILPSANVP